MVKRERHTFVIEEPGLLDLLLSALVLQLSKSLFAVSQHNELCLFVGILFCLSSQTNSHPMLYGFCTAKPKKEEMTFECMAREDEITVQQGQFFKEYYHIFDFSL